MSFGIGVEIIEWVVIIQVFVILIMIMTTYGAKYLSILLGGKRAALTAAIEKHFTDLIHSQSPLNMSLFKRKWMKLQILYPVFVRFNNQYHNHPSWNKLRDELFMKLLLPLARKRGRSIRWIVRFYASEVLALMCTKQDERLILRLLRDRVPLVYLHSIQAAIKCGTEETIDAVITRSAKMSRMSQAMYLKPFDEASDFVKKVVEDRLQAANEPDIRAECYNILCRFSKGQLLSRAEYDLQSEHCECRLAALTYFVHIEANAAIPKLIEKLNDPYWEIRSFALSKLATMKDMNVLPEIAACLSSDEWHVKMAAAHALTSFGPNGVSVLKEKAPHLVNIFDEK